MHLACRTPRFKQVFTGTHFAAAVLSTQHQPGSSSHRRSLHVSSSSLSSLSSSAAAHKPLSTAGPPALLPVVYHPLYSAPQLASGHRFPMQVFGRIYDRLLQQQLIQPSQVRPAASCVAATRSLKCTLGAPSWALLLSGLCSCCSLLPDHGVTAVPSANSLCLRLRPSSQLAAADTQSSAAPGPDVPPPYPANTHTSPHRPPVGVYPTLPHTPTPAATGAHPTSAALRRPAGTGALPRLPGSLLKPHPGRHTRAKVRQTECVCVWGGLCVWVCGRPASH